MSVGLSGFVLFAIGGAGGLASFTGLPLLLVMFAAMYFLLIAPNQKKQKQWQTQLSAIKAGDKVTTNGGMRGTVVAVEHLPAGRLAGSPGGPACAPAAVPA